MIDIQKLIVALEEIASEPCTYIDCAVGDSEPSGDHDPALYFDEDCNGEVCTARKALVESGWSMIVAANLAVDALAALVTEQYRTDSNDGISATPADQQLFRAARLALINVQRAMPGEREIETVDVKGGIV